MGRNQRNGFLADLAGDHDKYLDALFNRNGQSCRELYDRLVGKPSPTRTNTGRLVAGLRNVGVSDVIETNVICYSTAMSADLSLTEHDGGFHRGSEIFQVVFETSSRDADPALGDYGPPTTLFVSGDVPDME